MMRGKEVVGAEGVRRRAPPTWVPVFFPAPPCSPRGPQFQYLCLWLFWRWITPFYERSFVSGRPGYFSPLPRSGPASAPTHASPAGAQPLPVPTPGHLSGRRGKQEEGQVTFTQASSTRGLALGRSLPRRLSRPPVAAGGARLSWHQPRVLPRLPERGEQEGRYGTEGRESAPLPRFGIVSVGSTPTRPPRPRCTRLLSPPTAGRRLPVPPRSSGWARVWFHSSPRADGPDVLPMGGAAHGEEDFGWIQGR
ncbi:hypothetical protein NDU88_002002 [Pleurodeles waltl]|uniref:Uncharacterized protein n=1 Tax=Pleurodeles waltl TaxID=8319 RepID=A0AAV7WK12_PLEWA|nr:hypothetical protein NDU88_002002 [Pleurodeles waltl]